MDLGLSARFRLNGSRIVHEGFENEVVIVNLDSGRYYCLTQVGAEIWQLMLSGHCLGEMATGLAARYSASETEIAQAIGRLCGELQEQTLIIEADVDPAAAPAAIILSADQPRRPFEPPRLQTYTDMQDLLLLDPIHEVDPAGWPVAQTENNGQPR